MKKYSLFCLAAMALLLLSACGGTEPEPPQQVSYPMTDDYVLCLREGSTTGILSGVLRDESKIQGVEVTLSASPVVADDVFFFPLEDVVEILGGTCEIQGDLARVELFGDTILYQIDMPVILVNGESNEMRPERPAFREGDVAIPSELAVPRWINGVFYVADGFYEEAGGGFAGEHAPKKGVLILNHQLWDEISVEGLSVAEGTVYHDLPKEVKKGFQKTRTIPGDDDVWYDMDVYERPGMELYVMNVPTEFEEAGYAGDGEICGIRVTESGIPTARGLQVGDTESRFDQLYGYLNHPLNIAFHLTVEIEDGQVAWYGLDNRYLTFDVDRDEPLF